VKRILIYWPTDHYVTLRVVEYAMKEWPKAFIGATDDGLLIQDEQEGLANPMTLSEARQEMLRTERELNPV
jgi:hypothetical protein